MKSNAPSRGPQRERETIASREGGKSALAPGLYVVATPIGNARDVTLRALDVIGASDLVLAEDTRVTAKLLAIHGLKRPLSAYNDHNAPRERPRVLERLKARARIVLVSDAGTPLVSDPGFKLVREAIGAGIAVYPVPGASALLAGLVLSGLPTDRFLFAGFLPAKRAERRRALAELASIRATLVFFESAPRLAESLADMADTLGAREAAVTRELTKLHEEARRDTLGALAQSYAREAPKGEVTVVVHGADAEPRELGTLLPMLRRAMQYMPLSEAVALVAEASGASRTQLYASALKLKSDA